MKVMNIINNYRKSAGISEKKMANDLGIGERSLRGYFAGETSPKLSFILQCADYFNVPVTDFFQGPNNTNTALVKGKHIEGARFNYQSFNDPEENYQTIASLQREVNALREIIDSKNKIISMLEKQAN